MKNAGILIGIICLYLSSCKYKSPGNDDHTRTHLLTTEKADEENVLPVNPFVIYLDLPGGKVSQEIHKSENQTIEVVFHSGNYDTLHAALFSDDDQANISIVGIIRPDSLSEGPFGRSLTYDFPMEGNYRLVIDENEMAGESWSGDFRVEMELLCKEDREGMNNF